MPLTPPVELLDLVDGEEREFTVLRVERDELTFRPPGRLEPVTSPAMRLHVEPREKPIGPPYYDVTARTLQAQLEPQLVGRGLLPRRVAIRKVGVAPAARFSVRFAPVGQEASP